MNPDEFGLSILASYLANKADKVAEFVFGRNAQRAPKPEPEKSAGAGPEQCEEWPKFRAFDAWSDLPEFLKTVSSPVVSLLIEDQPSTHYNLLCLVLESADTGEWYVFSRDRMSFQGTGGGFNNSRDIIERLKMKRAPIGVWVVQKAILDSFEEGRTLWPELKPRAIPLLSFLAKDLSWSGIQHNAQKLIQNV